MPKCHQPTPSTHQPTQSLSNAPTYPIALQRTHLLAPPPDRLTNTATTLHIIRENTLSGRDFTIQHFRQDEPINSPRRHTLLYTVTGKFWSNSHHREIRDAAGKPLLELRRLWWRGQWSVKRTGPGGRELLSVEMRWAIASRMLLRFENALVPGRSRFPTQSANRHDDDYDEERDAPPPPYTPPSYSTVIAEDLARNTGEGGSHGSDRSNDKITTTLPPSYDTVQRRRSTHSLRDLLDAIEPPREPAPAPLSHQRRRSEGGIDPKVELKVVQQNGTVSFVMMGDQRIVYIRRTKVMDYSLSGPMAKWEVEVAEGVDLLLVVSIVLIMAEFVRHEYRIRIS